MNFLPDVPLDLTVLAVAVAVALGALRVSRARARARRRVVEKPNSYYYPSQIVRGTETRHRWSHIALDRLHEVNRAEVVRLLARVEATSVDALLPNERTFLDRMAELADNRPPAARTGTEEQGTPDLRHKPA